MFNAQSLNTKVFFERIWNEKTITKRSLFASFLIPFVLVVILMLVKLTYNPHVIRPPYVLFFAVVLASACYGGAKSAVFASIISFLAALLLLLIPVTLPSNKLIVTHLIEAFAFCFEALFLSYLIFYFQIQRKRNKEAALSMKTINQLLRAREKDHENFVHMAAHELKSPVTVLKGYLQIIEPKLIAGKREEEVRLLAKMELQLEKLVKRINDLLDLAKVNAGPMQYNMYNFDLNECLLHCIEDIKISNPHFTVECNLTIGPVIVNGDKERIQQVVANLLGNAIKYSAKEQYVKLTSEVIGQQIMVKVIDHGIGIPLDKKEFVFEKFYRVNETLVMERPGLGLGLFICNEIIKYHQGRMGLDSTEGRGSVFWFVLPFASKQMPANS